MTKWYKFWEWYIFQAKQKKWYILLLFLGITFFSVSYAFKLPLESDLSRLLPEETQSVKKFNELKNLLGGIGFYIVIFESPVANREELQLQAGRFAESLRRNPELDEKIKSIHFEVPKEFLKRYALLYTDLSDLKAIYRRLEKKIAYEVRMENKWIIDIVPTKKVHFYYGDIVQKYRKKNIHYEVFMDPEFRRVAVFIKPTQPATDLDFNKKVYRLLNKELDNFSLPEGWKHFIAGRYMQEPEQNRILSSDIAKTSGLTILVLLITLILFFRSLRATIAVGLPLAAGIAWTFAITYMTIGRISLISAFLASILLGLGVDYGIHLFSRYKEERVQGKGITESLVITYSTIFSSIGYGALTTSIAFLSVALSQFIAFSEFGVIAFTGILCCLFAFLIGFPVLIFVTERILPERLPSAKVNRGRYRYLRVWLSLGLILNLVGIMGIYDFDFEYNFSKLNAVSPELELARKKLATIIERSDSPIVFDVSSPKQLRELDKYINSKESKYIGTTQSLLMFMPKRLKEKKETIGRIDLLLRRARSLISRNSKIYKQMKKVSYFTKVQNFSLNSLPDELRKPMVQRDENGKLHYFYYIYPENTEKSKRGIIDFAAENRSICLEESKNFLEPCSSDKILNGAADSIILQDILDLILKDALRGTAMVLTIVVILLFIIIRNIPGFLLIIGPLFSGLLSLAATMYVADVFFDHTLFKLNYINIVAIPVLLGVGIDNGLHLFRRYRENLFQDVNFVMSETGNAVFISNFTTAIGFSSLVFSSHTGLASLGLMTAFGIINIFIAYVTLFPFAANRMKKYGFRFD